MNSVMKGIMSRNDLLMDIINENLSLIIGPSTDNFDEIFPKVICPPIFFMLPSFILMSNTEEIDSEDVTNDTNDDVENTETDRS